VELAAVIETQRSPARTNRIRLSHLQDIGMQPAKGGASREHCISDGQIALGKSTGEVHATQQREAGAALPAKGRRDVVRRRPHFY
jgi:hypothetical protein